MSDDNIDHDESSDCSIETDWEASPLDPIQAKSETRIKTKLKGNQMQQFIREVRQRQVLWNYKFHCYKDKDFKEFAWEEIASIFGVTSDECRRKWKCLKVYMGRECAKPENERTWTYLNQLDFIRPFTGVGRCKPIANENQSYEDPSPFLLDTKYDFAEKLIAEIERNPILWNLTHDNYKSVNHKFKVWRKIARSLDTTVDKCKNKWKALRDIFSRTYAKNPDVESNHWVHFEQMIFLAPHLKGKKLSFAKSFESIEVEESDDEESLSSRLSEENSHNDKDNPEKEKEVLEFSTEEFIKEMQNKPMLWDLNHRQYKVFKLRNLAWQEVAECFEMPVEDCKRKWRILRDMFVRIYSKNSNEADITWKYYNEMMFLAPFVKEKKDENISATAVYNVKAEDSNDESEFYESRLNMEDLIEAVKQHPLLWDSTNENCRSNHLRLQAWEKIADHFSLSIEYCKKKWRLLRDTFVRTYFKNEENITWKYYEQIKFLEPFIKDKNSRVLIGVSIENQKSEGSQTEDTDLYKAKTLKELNSEALIEAVQQRRLLWDTSTGNYRSNDLRIQAWEEIAEYCCLSLEDCKRRWRALRDTFARNLFKYPKEEEINWKYFKQMKFLAPYLRDKKDKNLSAMPVENLKSETNEYSHSSSSEESQNEETEFYRPNKTNKLKVEDFIESVRRRRVLWDTNNKNNRRQELRQYAWEEIATNFSLTKMGSVEDCKKKWKALRDAFTRLYFKPIKEEKKCWKYYKQMKFLGPILKTRKATNLLEDSCEDSDLKQTVAEEENDRGTSSAFEETENDDSDDELSALKTKEQLATEEFIDVMKQHVILWDTKNENYRLQDERQEAWEDIAAHFAFSVEECKNKWKVLRDSFVRNYFKPTKEKRIHWYYYKQMKFLGPHVKHKKGLILPSGYSSNKYKPEECDDSTNMFEHTKNDESQSSKSKTPKKYSVKDFILEIKKQKILWDVSHEHCRNKKFRQKAWREIASNFSLSVLACKKKWATLRNAFAREFAKHPENAVWEYFKELDFLLPYLKANSIYSNEPGVSEIGFRLADGQVVSKDTKDVTQISSKSMNEAEIPRTTWIDTFILAVEQERSLWDPTHKNYKEPLKKQQAWNEIAKKSGLSINDSKRKWKSLRDSLTVSLNKQGSKEDNKWRYLKAMEFLRPHLRLHIRNQNMCSVDQNNSDSNRTDKMKLKNDDESTLQFIEAVKERNFLWNWDDVDHMNTNKTEEAWNQIAKQFGLSITECNQRWQTLEKTYTAIISRSSDDKNSSWPFLKEMAFLRPFIKANIPTTNFVEVPGGLSFNDIIEEDYFPEPYMVSKYEDEDEEDALFEEMVELTTPKVEIVEIQNHSTRERAAAKRRKYSVTSSESDEDKEFYQSLKQKFKKLSTKKKRDAKAHIQAYLSVVAAVEDT